MAFIECIDACVYTAAAGPESRANMTLKFDTKDLLSAPQSCVNTNPGYQSMLCLRGTTEGELIALTRESPRDIQLKILNTKPKRDAAAPSAMHRAVVKPANIQPLVTRAYIAPAPAPRPHMRPVSPASRSGR